MKRYLTKVVVLLFLMSLLVGCQAGGLQIIGSNLEDYNLQNLDPAVNKIQLKFSKELEKADFTLVRNGEEVADPDFDYKIDGADLTLENLNLQPTTTYHLSILAAGKSGGQILDTVKFKTKRTSYPEVKEYNETMLQTFYWFMHVNKDEVDRGIKPGMNYADKYPEEEDLWNLLSNRAGELAELGITSLWVPPAHKCHEQQDEGYGVYDLWDLGEFKQQETVRTKYGTKEELEKALSSLHEVGIEVYYDIVMNQRIGGGVETVPLKNGGTIKARTDFKNSEGRQKYYSRANDFKWNWRYFDGTNYDADKGYGDKKLFKGKEWDDSYGKDYLIASDVDYQNPNVQHELKEWGEWIIDEVGFDGYRVDAVKHVHTPFIKEWLKEVQQNTEKDIFYVGEVWFEETDQLEEYLELVDNPDLNLFDFALQSNFEQMKEADFDMSTLSNSGLVNNKQYRERAVTFIDNHDTHRGTRDSGVTKFKYQAYTYILLREYGLPTIFWKNYYQQGMKAGLDKLLKARRYFAYGKGYEVDNNDADVYSYVRAGRDDLPGTGLVMMISDGTSGETISKVINSRQANTTFYDYTGNIEGVVTTDNQGRGEFKVKASEEEGWSVWVPVQQGK